MVRSGFERRMVRIPAGNEHPYVESDWHDELVIVACGTLELEGLSGHRWKFPRGSILWLQDLPLRALHSAGEETAVLMTVSRPMSSRPPDRLI